MSVYLTGPPSLNGVVLPRPSARRPMDVIWKNEGSSLVSFSGQQKARPAKWRGLIRFGYESLTPAEAAEIIAALASPMLLFKPRTMALGDPVGAVEYELNCRLRSPLPSTANLATTRVPFTIELETVGTFAKIPGHIEGSLSLIAEDTDSYTFQTTGDAAFVEETYQVTFFGVTYTRTRVQFSPGGFFALRIKDETMYSIRIAYDQP